MLINHFNSHKRKYIGFLAVAALVTSGTYLIYKTEASSLAQNVPGRRCLPFLRELRRPLPPNHPCFLQSLNRQEVLPVIGVEQPVVPLSAATSTGTITSTLAATTTPEESSATSTVEISSSTPTE